MHILLWAIWHNRPDTVSLAITLGANIHFWISETHNLDRSTIIVDHGNALEIAVRNRLDPTEPAAHQLALDVCTVLLTAGGTPNIHVIGSIAQAGDTELLRVCLPYITDINAHTDPYGYTVLQLATTAGQDAVVALLSAAGASMEGTGRYHLTPAEESAGVMVHVGGECTIDFRGDFPGWDHSRTGRWDEWGPVRMLPGISLGCQCPWCPREITGGHTFLDVGKSLSRLHLARL